MFADPSAYLYRPGSLFLGVDDQGQEIGIETDRHAITIAGSRSGKGAAFIIPNCRRWTHNLLCIDPKGENADASWQQREILGQAVHVLDPFRASKVPDRLRAAFNPLDGIEPGKMGGREDIQVIAEGLIKVHDPRHMDWVDAARSILSGIMAYVIECVPPEERTFRTVREILTRADEYPEGETDKHGREKISLYGYAQMMRDCEAFGGLAQSGAAVLERGLTASRGVEKDAIGKAVQATEWLDSPEIAATLDHSTFRLSDLKNRDTSVFLVLPMGMMRTHSTYLRLFTRCALREMERGGLKGKDCLFILDEFFSLGKMEEIESGAGSMPGYGVHLWPFLQDLGQLQKLYGPQGAETFFGNADAHIYFGNTDALTLQYISKQLGNWTPAEIGMPPQRVFFQKDSDVFLKNEFENQMSKFQHDARRIGSPRLPPENVAMTVRKYNDVVADSSIIIIHGTAIKIHLSPYFRPYESPPKNISNQKNNSFGSMVISGVCIALAWPWGQFILSSNINWAVGFILYLAFLFLIHTMYEKIIKA
ncbi:type IV secretory system conjugative DNA transfer family protein [Jiella marina]|uniref:type IV secretory system conjugative DNA transfer family protein n=1 Tax=Jiella sp. LLJ827 TaxID=2917712 RepID=UPI0021008CC9|nr:type IV secretory system conjugative DNA transfer family protein [Jiella sp. LLJ827]